MSGAAQQLRGGIVAEKKKFKFEFWMLGLAIIPIGISLSVYGSSKKGTVELGTQCVQNDDCKEGAGFQCVSVDGASVCAKQCTPGPNSGSYGCPAPFECAGVDMSVGGKVVPMHWCLKKGP